MTKPLSGKIALVTGGSRGLGADTALALARNGADVAISYVASEEKALAVAEKLKAEGVRAAAFRADQGDQTASEQLVRSVLDTFGALDILVNNAAVAYQGQKIDDPDLDHTALERQWMINTMGVIAVTRAASRAMNDGGRIISVGSGLGTRVAFPGVADYAATKAAIVAYSRGAARDLGSRGITVNVVQAGLMDTDMAAGAAGNLPPIIMESHAIPRFAGLEEVSAAIVFLAGPDANFITGSVLDVNGGFTS